MLAVKVKDKDYKDQQKKAKILLDELKNSIGNQLNIMDGRSKI